jgi:hypothetical protein
MPVVIGVALPADIAGCAVGSAPPANNPWRPVRSRWTDQNDKLCADTFAEIPLADEFSPPLSTSPAGSDDSGSLMLLALPAN